MPHPTSHRGVTPDVNRAGALAWSLAGLALLVTSTQLAFVTADKFGQGNEGRILSGVVNLWEQGHTVLAGLVTWCGIVAPFLVLGGIATAAALPRWSGGDALMRLVRRIEPWSMPEVRLLAILVALVKLSSEVAAQSATGLWCYGAAAVCALAASRAMGVSEEPTNPPWLRGRAPAAACSLGALVLLVPAYTLPVMTFTSLGNVQTDTIFSGVLNLWQSGLWGLALIVFTASLVVPLFKLAGVGVLLLAGRRGQPSRGLTRLHRLVHGIGRWSMLDVFLVAFLCGIVRFGTVADVDAHPGVLAFAGAVVLTMLSTAALENAQFESAPAQPV